MPQNVGTYILYIVCNVFNVSEILCVAYGMGLHFSYIADLLGLMKVILWLLHPDHKSRATLKDLNRDKWMNQSVDVSQYSFESVLGGMS